MNDKRKFLQVGYDDLLRESGLLYVENKKLQSNWNSLRECIIGVIDGAREELNTIMHGDDLEYINKRSLQYEAIRKNLEIVLDKMNELEGVSNDS